MDSHSLLSPDRRFLVGVFPFANPEPFILALELDTLLT